MNRITLYSLNQVKQERALVNSPFVVCTEEILLVKEMKQKARHVGHQWAWIHLTQQVSHKVIHGEFQGLYSANQD